MTDREKELERLLRRAVEELGDDCNSMGCKHPDCGVVKEVRAFLASSLDQEPCPYVNCPRCTPAQEETCDATHGPWTCKLQKGHAGQHNNAAQEEKRYTLAEVEANVVRVWVDADHSRGLNPFLRDLRAALKESP